MWDLPAHIEKSLMMLLLVRPAEAIFKRFDKDGSGTISKDELSKVTASAVSCSSMLKFLDCPVFFCYSCCPGAWRWGLPGIKGVLLEVTS